VFEEFMRNRADQLLKTVNVLVADYGFKTAWSSGDRDTIRSALLNQARRVGATVGLLLDLDGNVVVSSVDHPAAAYDGAFTPLPEGTSLESVSHRVLDIGGSIYQTVTVPLRAPVTVAWVMLGFPIDEALAEHIQSLTGLEVSFARFAGQSDHMVASTLLPQLHSEALAGLNPREYRPQRTSAAEAHAGFLTLLRPFLGNVSDVYIALQLSMREATASYRSIRNILLIITSSSLLLAVSGAFWLANTVTRPVELLVAAARRMREGVYTEPIDVATTDELGELADSFNTMQEAIADRERHIVYQAHHDSLSGLPSRELVISRLRDAVEASSRLSVVSLALDRFNGIVSSLGHRAGEEVVKLVAGLLRNRVDEGQILGHLSAHEFVLALPGYDAQQAVQWIEYFADLLRAGVRVGGANISLQATAGIACHPEHSNDAAELCRRASIARSDALLQHQTSAVYRIGQEDRSLQQIKIVGDFQQAITSNELRLSLQPKIDCRTGDVIGAEALVRWQHPELGLLMPAAFVDAIEQAGAIAHLTRWVLREAVARCREWRDHGVALTVAANISVDDLADEYLPYFLLDIVKRHDLKPADVTLEVTESAIMHNVHKSLAVASCIHELGFRIAIDDFGTGQSALAQIKRLPLHELKIDKSFVMNIADRCDLAIVRTTIELAHRLGLGVVAEGVEDEHVLQTLQGLGCDYVQGYHICSPLPHQEFLPWLAQWQAKRHPGVVAFAPKATAAGRVGTVS
jgi:diguanylate cyclase (GGDEF)-like protein